MSDPTVQLVPLLRMEIRLEHDVVLCRGRAREYAAALGFDPQAQICVAAAVSEIARNALQYATGGAVELQFEIEPRPAEAPPQTLIVMVSDAGPGIVRSEEMLNGVDELANGGLGILGVRRLMDSVKVATSPAGTVVTMRKALTPGLRPLNAAEVQALVDAISRQAPLSAIEETRLQNHALMRAMEQARAREEEIVRMNRELAETNSGVLALYDELETLHRVSVQLASKLELQALIQSIIDTMSEVTDADLGAFFLRGEGESWSLYASAGPERSALAAVPARTTEDYFGPEFRGVELLRVDDLKRRAELCCASRFASAIQANFKVRSCLTVPIVASDDEVLGAMIFVASAVGRFSERSERIVGAIASQAAVSIEKSRLFGAAKASSAAKDQFLAMISHELRTPLNPVLAIVSSWHEDPRVPEVLREEIAMVLRNVRLEVRLIDDLLDFNKIVNGKLQIDHAVVDLHHVISSVVEICGEELNAKSQRLELTLAAPQATVDGDAARLQQVLWNLLKNAIKFTPVKGGISIHTSNPTPERLRIVILDTGRGIQAEALSRIFGAFEQSDAYMAPQFGGLGLGLAISKTFVERHGGTINAASSGLGLGSQFTIELPLSAVALLAPVDSLSPLARPAASKPARILLVEDHFDSLVTLTRLLTRKGHTVTPVANGATARTELAEHAFDLIISDLGLPDCSGLDLISEVRKLHATPAIALSGYGMDTDVRSSMAAGFNEHLTKPIDLELLLRTLDRLVASAQVGS